MVQTKYSFWPNAANEEYYVVKLKKGTAMYAVHHHNSNSIYQVFGYQFSQVLF
ncbi:hypothetical protein ACTAZI_07680 [Legionella bozemanae]|uniref:hypothetical protein n=1 Tax=Legionella bozemanae TaxID=447 RepID=UPI003EEF67E6